MVTGNTDLLASSLRTRRPTLIYGARSTAALLERIRACVPSVKTIDARDAVVPLAPADNEVLVLLLPAEMPGYVEDALARLASEVALLAVTPAERLSPAMIRAFPHRFEEEHVLERSVR